MPDPRYEHAKTLRREGRTAEASSVLTALLAERPGDIGALYALAVCQIDTGQRGHARENLLRIAGAHPDHYGAHYQLGRLLQDEGDLRAAAVHYRQVLAVTEYADAAARLAQCERAAAVPPVKKMIEQTYVADRGALVQSLRLRARHVLPLGSIATVLLAFVAARLLNTSGVGLQLAYPLVLIVLALLLNVALSPITIYIRTRMYTAQLYDYGMDVSEGVFRRSKQFVWYYQITEPPTYVRKPADYLTHTASLIVNYNNTAATTARVRLRGFGSPRQVDQVRSYLQSRIPSERLPIRGPWT
ncbi:tetratricopeptide repeat protein [Nocardia lijiangensis]|uniref:tetratricopeptide repeat protein n=1 Tax=Nocardia lijiangensis TaxID=299618 RepID=UPI00138FF8FD|nr:tetratricopeptide repeat protein [Nocardia lijiangensis]